MEHVYVFYIPGVKNEKKNKKLYDPMSKQHFDRVSLSLSRFGFVLFCFVSFCWVIKQFVSEYGKTSYKKKPDITK
jgi:hypothetical protein